jgi:hypothetical protein
MINLLQINYKFVTGKNKCFCLILYASVSFCKLLFNFVNYVFFYVFLLLCTFRSGYSVSLFCSVYCSCVNVYCTTATGCQRNCR